MILGIRFLDNYCGTNSYTLTPQLTFAEGSNVTVNFELIDLSKNTYVDPPGDLYIAAASPTPVLSIIVQNIDVQFALTKVPTQIPGTPFWTMNFAVGEILGGTYGLLLTLVEGTNTTVGHSNSALLVLPITPFPTGGGYGWFTNNNGYNPNSC